LNGKSEPKAHSRIALAEARGTSFSSASRMEACFSGDIWKSGNAMLENARQSILPLKRSVSFSKSFVESK
jgi:hypothetical protein